MPAMPYSLFPLVIIVTCAAAEPGGGTGTVPQGPEDCNPGDMFSPAFFQCFTCDAGRYSAKGEVCQDCQPGKFSSSRGSTICSNCAAGKYSGEVSSICRDCPAGTASDEGQGECSECPAGTTSGHGQGSCDTCSPGTYSIDGLGCVPCPAGTYGIEGQCFDCPAGQISAEGSTQCVSCAAGKYSQGSTVCTDCPAGEHSSMPGMAQCESCPLGQVSLQGQSSCSMCSAGKYSDLGLQCVDCEAGRSSLRGTVSCGNCEAGTISAAGSSSCTTCDAGTYSKGSVECAGCPVGKFSAEGSGSCNDCPAGRVGNGVVGEQCISCEAGKYSTSTTQCENCPRGMFSAAEQGSCTTCAAGKFSIEGSSVCEDCPAGKTSQAGYECRHCPAGAIPHSGKVCVSCPAGKASNEGDLECHICGAGTYTSDGECKVCDTGKLSHRGAGAEVDCKFMGDLPNGPSFLRVGSLKVWRGEFRGEGASSRPDIRMYFAQPYVALDDAEGRYFIGAWVRLPLMSPDGTTPAHLVASKNNQFAVVFQGKGLELGLQLGPRWSTTFLGSTWMAADATEGWHHVAVISHGSRATFYVDKNEVHSVHGALPPGTEIKYVGAYTEDNGQRMGPMGWLADVIIYAGQAPGNWKDAVADVAGRDCLPRSGRRFNSPGKVCNVASCLPSFPHFVEAWDNCGLYADCVMIVKAGDYYKLMRESDTTVSERNGMLYSCNDPQDKDDPMYKLADPGMESCPPGYGNENMKRECQALGFHFCDKGMAWQNVMLKTQPSGCFIDRHTEGRAGCMVRFNVEWPWNLENPLLGGQKICKKW